MQFAAGSTKEKAILEVATPIPRLPFIDLVSFRAFWLFSIKVMLINPHVQAGIRNKLIDTR